MNRTKSNFSVIIQITKWIFVNYKKSPKYLLIIFFLAILSIGVHVISSLLSAEIINSLSISNLEKFKTSTYCFILSIIFIIVFDFLSRIFILRYTEDIASTLRRRLFLSILNKRINFFTDNYVGDITARIINDIGAIKGFVPQIVMQIVADLITIIVVAVVIIYLHPFLAVLILLSAPLSIIIGRYSKNIIKNNSQSVRNSISQITEVIQVWFNSFFTLKVFQNEHIAERDFNKSNYKLQCKIQNAEIYNIWISSTGFFVSKLPFIVILLYGGNLVLHNQLNIGLLFTLITLAGYFTTPIQRIINSLTITLPSIYPIYQRIKLYTKFENNLYLRDNQKEGYEIERVLIKNVFFNFPNSNFTLNAKKIDLVKNQIVSISGSNGSGKTTLGLIIAGIYSSSTCELFVNDILIDDKKWLQSNSLLFTKNIDILKGTVLENITNFHRNPNLKEIDKIKDLLLDDIIAELPEGLSTRISKKDEFRFSGGELQKIHLAKFMYTVQQIIILDEPENYLDQINKKLLINVIKKISPNKIILIITHSPELLAITNKRYHIVKNKERNISEVIELK